MKKIKAVPKICLIGLGFIFTFLGIVGFVVPLMPGFVFILLASFCFSRSSERFHEWLLNNPMFGELLRQYLAGKGIPETAKKKAIAVIWLSFAISAFVAANVMVTLGLVVFGVVLSVYLMRLPSYSKAVKTSS
ncbi:DUF454 domain-containing protein [Saccharobesus litoralis]|uniref:Inner membrane protein n=1 Tax=Saccharobesus litoralis TaxID=2172099 RepID=A0A2S0VUE8_9ALTE|nr:YbaN family protein [Saccharobesus litoralis]AWB67720.1 DUF454 domain-containing protein [Saccharobesus litoralis]